jgi:hypothetical protein
VSQQHLMVAAKHYWSWHALCGPDALPVSGATQRETAAVWTAAAAAGVSTDDNTQQKTKAAAAASNIH